MLGAAFARSRQEAQPGDQYVTLFKHNSTEFRDHRRNSRNSELG